MRLSVFGGSKMFNMWKGLRITEGQRVDEAHYVKRPQKEEPRLLLVATELLAQNWPQFVSQVNEPL
jgi:hypothetical protein